MPESDVIIIGGGPAGVSAALYTQRAGLSTKIITAGPGALEKAHAIENYYGLAVSGPELLRIGLAQAQGVGVEVLTAEVLDVMIQNKAESKAEKNMFIVETTVGSYCAQLVILAAGTGRTKPKWPGLADFEGRGVSYCAACDAFFHRGKDVAVAGSGAYALHEAQALLPLVRSVTVCTDAAAPEAPFPPEVRVITQPVVKLEGGELLTQICFKDGSALPVSGLFVAMGTTGALHFARNLGLALQGDAIIVDAAMRTSVPGLFAAGDCTGGMKQIAKAVYEGAVAGTEAVGFFRTL